MKKKYAEFHTLQQQFEHLQKYSTELESKLLEFHQTKSALEEFRDIKPGDEMFIPVASGVFVKASALDSSELLVNVGANVAVAKSLQQVSDIIDKQIIELQGIHEKLEANLVAIAERLNELLEELK